VLWRQPIGTAPVVGRCDSRNRAVTLEQARRAGNGDLPGRAPTANALAYGLAGVHGSTPVEGRRDAKDCDDFALHPRAQMPVRCVTLDPARCLGSANLTKTRTAAAPEWGYAGSPLVLRWQSDRQAPGNMAGARSSPYSGRCQNRLARRYRREIQLPLPAEPRGRACHRS